MILNFNNFINESSSFSEIIHNKNYITYLHSNYRIEHDVEYEEVSRKTTILNSNIFSNNVKNKNISYIIKYSNYIILITRKSLNNNNNTIVDIYDTILNKNIKVFETTSSQTICGFLFNKLNIDYNLKNCDEFSDECTIYKFKFKIENNESNIRIDKIAVKCILEARDYVIDNNKMLNLLLSSYLLKITDVIKNKQHDFLNNDLDIEYLYELSNDLKYIKKIRNKIELVVDYNMIIKYFKTKLNLKNLLYGKFNKRELIYYGLFKTANDRENKTIIDFYNNNDKDKINRELLLYVYKELLNNLNFKKYEDILADNYDVNKIFIKDNKIYYDKKLITQTEIYNKLEHLLNAKNFDLF